MGNYAKPDVLVDADWVQANGSDANVRLVEVDVDTNAYNEGHIAGAVAWNWTTELQDQLNRDIASREQIEGLLSRSGIGPDTTIVLYGDNNNWFAAYAYWLLKLYGHDDVRLMNGGRKKWLADSRPTTQDVPSFAATGYRAKDGDASLRARKDDVLAGLGKQGVALVDVRSPAEFSGEIIAPPGMTETAQRAGHIPGAASVPWLQSVNEDGTFKSAEELEAIYGGKGVTADKAVTAYCRIGERSSHTWFVLRELLGYPNVANYDGSWTEWGSSIGTPIEKPA